MPLLYFFTKLTILIYILLNFICRIWFNRIKCIYYFITININIFFFQKAKYLYRTARFVDWCLTTGRQRKVPDNLYSLFEGIVYLYNMYNM